MEQIEVRVSHVLDRKQLDSIRSEAYLATLEGIQQAREDSKIDSDILFTKVELCHFLNDCSMKYLDELLADESFPRGKTLSERKQCFSKRAIRRYLLNKQK